MVHINPYIILYGFLNIIIFLFLAYKFWFTPEYRNEFKVSLAECSFTPNSMYTKNHMIARRRLDDTIWELYYYLSDQIRLNKNDTKFQTFGKQAIDHAISLMAQSSNFDSDIDHINEWHRLELKKLSNFIIERIHKHQHPESCKKSKILICALHFHCGIGCIIRRLAHCLRLGIASERTMIVDKKTIDWHYSKQGLDLIFKPLSKCTYLNSINHGDNIVNFTSIYQNDRLVILHDRISENYTDKLPLSIPQQLTDKLLTHHSNPADFFHANFKWYVSQLNHRTQQIVDRAVSSIKLEQGLIVGIHIRRTDKLDVEASFHSVDEYFEWAEMWFQLQERKRPGKPKLKRRVYIATDDPNAIQEAKTKFPHFEIQSNVKIAETASGKMRFSEASLFNVLVEMNILSKCNFVVCTLSSNVCRVAYELMQLERGDAEKHVLSLDTYYRKDFSAYVRDFVALENHTANNASELSFKVGDIISADKFEGNLHNGFSSGFLKVSQGKVITKRPIRKKPEGTDWWHMKRYIPDEGIYPSFKTKEIWKIVDMPMFNL